MPGSAPLAKGDALTVAGNVIGQVSVRGAEVPDLELLEWWASIFEIPCVAIGGITPDNCRPLVEAGADFIAVSGAVWNGDEVAAVQAFAKALRG